MKNIAIYIRTICILLCVTVVVVAVFSIVKPQTKSTEEVRETAAQTEATEEVAEAAAQTEATEEVTEVALQTEATEEVTEAASQTEDTEEAIETTLQTEAAEELTAQIQTIKGSIKKGRAIHTYVHNQEEHTLYIGDKTKPAIALTFDDGPSWEPTTRILDVLQAYDVRATFFTMGYKAKTFSEQLVREHALRCEVANHSYNHPKLTKISAAKVKKQITRTSKLIEQAVGENTHLVRPPYGAYNDMVLEQINAPAILWSIDTRDWKTRNADKTVASVLESVEDGDIILMHDVYEPTAEAVERLVPELLDRGYQLVTVPELAVLKGKKLKKGEVYNRIDNE